MTWIRTFLAGVAAYWRWLCSWRQRRTYNPAWKRDLAAERAARRRLKLLDEERERLEAIARAARLRGFDTRDAQVRRQERNKRKKRVSARAGK